MHRATCDQAEKGGSEDHDPALQEVGTVGLILFGSRIGTVPSVREALHLNAKCARNRSSKCSCRLDPLSDSRSWQSSIRSTSSTPRRDEQDSIRPRVPFDASVDQRVA